ncbi:hypothetical protein GcC1_192015 [Golovinomyces cichoracearum]|uniref:Uncharacterized protein n=1 Tax=Golovinomyces cichoracearum TaxID=62708 RepID=A0A420HHX1_9PEZI|nr:hypothetical protein GcC1_192015 [Golovinomyces cichoracearum]
MARDSEIHENFVELARKEVVFDVKDLEEALPRKKLDSTAHARRRSKFGENEYTGMETEDPFEDLPPEIFNECRYAITTESLNSAIQQGVIDPAIKYRYDAKRPTFPFRPFTKDGKQIWSNFTEEMDFDQFKKDSKQNPEYVFQEFKFRSLGLLVLFNEIHNLYEIAQCLDHNQNTFYKMLTTLKKFSPKQELRDPNQSLVAEIVVQKKKIQELNQQLSETNQVAADLMIRG